MAVPHVGLARQEASLAWQRKAGEDVVGKRVVQLFDPLEPDRDLRVDDGVDAQLGLGRVGIRHAGRHADHVTAFLDPSATRATGDASECLDEGCETSLDLVGFRDRVPPGPL
jgi:hypothetical protein